MAATGTKIGHGLAKVLGIKLDQNNPYESVFSVSSADTYVEEEPTTREWIASVTPSGKTVINYFHNLLPFTKWITRYNSQWLIGDLVAGKSGQSAPS
jgi:solute carrier family 26 (sodium-independent sulfate anion transporter), member 11